MYMQNRNTLTVTENKLVITSGKRDREKGMIVYGIKKYKLLSKRQISNKNIWYNMGNYSHYFIRTFLKFKFIYFNWRLITLKYW